MNRHPYVDAAGNPVVGAPLTKFMFTNAVIAATCPKCASVPGYYCETPKGRKAWPPHSERLGALPREVVELSRLEVG